MSLIDQVFLKLLTLKDLFIEIIAGLVSENPLAVNVLKNRYKFASPFYIFLSVQASLETALQNINLKLTMRSINRKSIFLTTLLPLT